VGAAALAGFLLPATARRRRTVSGAAMRTVSRRVTGATSCPRAMFEFSGVNIKKCPLPILYMHGAFCYRAHCLSTIVIFKWTKINIVRFLCLKC
jgi:hypothetical protein